MSRAKPKSSKFPMFRPFGPPFIEKFSRIRLTMHTPNANVAIARLMPRARSAAEPTMTPTGNAGEHGDRDSDLEGHTQISQPGNDERPESCYRPLCERYLTGESGDDDDALEQYGTKNRERHGAHPGPKAGRTSTPPPLRSR